MKKQIAILGGGVGAISAAFALTDRPDWRDDYEITIYQLGWRLGGKAASGRGAIANRIEEHGIHIFFGFYENAFRMMRRCYWALEHGNPYPEPDCPADDEARVLLDAHFDRLNFSVLEDWHDGAWKHMPMYFPPNQELPGQSQRRSVGPKELLEMLVQWLWGKLRGEPRVAAIAEMAEAFARQLAPEAWAKDTSPDVAMSRALLGGVAESRVRALGIADLLEPLRRAIWDAIGEATAQDDRARRFWTAFDLSATVIKGMIVDDVVSNGYDVIDNKDLYDWLEKHGAHKQTLDSAYVRALYSQAFAFPNGNPKTPRGSAAVALRANLRMLFEYRGAFIWRMKSSMGETVFSPLYKLLQKRGVRIEFFRRVTGLRLTSDRRAIDAIELNVQAQTKGGSLYNPLAEKDRWPGEPLYDQLERGEEIKKAISDGKYVNFESAWSEWLDQEKLHVLKRGKHFDIVILGIPLGALPPITSDLAQASQEWASMLTEIKTVPTQAVQLWLRKPIGTTSPGVPIGSLVTAYEPLLDTWGDLTHTLTVEDWTLPEDEKPKQVAYFCGAMDDPGIPPYGPENAGFPRSQTARVRGWTKSFLTAGPKRGIAHLWPGAVDGNGHLKWDLLVDPRRRTGDGRLDAQFFLANVEPGERYVLALPGTLAARLRSDRSGFRNLYLAGDWTRSGISAGAAEAAVMSGIRAANHISGHPVPIVGEEDFGD